MTKQIYEIPHPNLETSIRYQILSPSQVEALAVDQSFNSHEIFMRSVLEAVVQNLGDDVTTELRKIPRARAKLVLNSIFNGCVMLNPGLDLNTWLKLTSPGPSDGKEERRPTKRKSSKKITRAQFLGLEAYLKDMVIGQNGAVDEIVHALKRSQVGLHDERRPLGVFLFAGASGVGKTHLARELHTYLFGTDYDLVRVDCGEYQHKHENSKLLGAPPGYLGYDDGGHLTNLVSKNPHTVVLLDEVEKAHSDLWHTFLRVFDEGMLTSGDGKDVSFRDTIIIMTTNLGNRQAVEDELSRTVGFGQGSEGQAPQRERFERLAQEAIRKSFQPEFLNRIDKTVIFNHLTLEDFEKISELELAKVNNKLSKRGFSLAFDKNVIAAMVSDGMSSVQGARRLAQIRRDKIEDKLADCLLGGRYPRGTVFQLTMQETAYTITAQKKVRVAKVKVE